MTTETATRQDWLHVLIKIQTLRTSAMTTDKSAQSKANQKWDEHHLHISMRLWARSTDMHGMRDRRFYT